MFPLLQIFLLNEISEYGFVDTFCSDSINLCNIFPHIPHGKAASSHKEKIQIDVFKKLLILEGE